MAIEWRGEEWTTKNLVHENKRSNRGREKRTKLGLSRKGASFLSFLSASAFCDVQLTVFLSLLISCYLVHTMA